MMPRLMSVALTEPQVRARTKTVTRRLGWKFLKPGDTITLCRKVMGRKKGEPLARICDVEIIDVHRESLYEVDHARRTDGEGRPISEMELEGFPAMSASRFIEFFGTHMKCDMDTEVTRIEWRYLEPSTLADHGPAHSEDGTWFAIAGHGDVNDTQGFISADYPGRHGWVRNDPGLAADWSDLADAVHWWVECAEDDYGAEPATIWSYHDMHRESPA